MHTAASAAAAGDDNVISTDARAAGRVAVDDEADTSALRQQSMDRPACAGAKLRKATPPVNWLDLLTPEVLSIHRTGRSTTIYIAVALDVTIFITRPLSSMNSRHTLLDFAVYVGIPLTISRESSY